VVDEVVNLQVGLGDKAAVELGVGRRLAKPAAQPLGGLVGQAVGEIVMGSEFCVRDCSPFGFAGAVTRRAGWRSET
jgi:hypothetical protein